VMRSDGRQARASLPFFIVQQSQQSVYISCSKFAGVLHIAYFW
jgi:hypothetical protein